MSEDMPGPEYERPRGTALPRTFRPDALMRALDPSVPCWFEGCAGLRSEHAALLASGLRADEAMLAMAEKVGRQLLGITDGTD